jgi:hypothetical protein
MLAHLPLQETFSALCFDVLVDQFGIPLDYQLRKGGRNKT